MPQFTELALWVNLAIFGVGAGCVWMGGAKIAHYADAISERTGLGQAMLGLILLGGVTSLPEFAVSLTAASHGDADLATSNALGGVAMQVVILALADFLIGRRALTSVVPDPAVILQGALGVLMLSIVAAGVVAGDVGMFGVGLWSWGLLVVFLFAIRQLALAERRERPWIANLGEEQKRAVKEHAEIARRRRQSTSPDPWPALAGKTVAAAAVILIAGYFVARSGEAIAEQTGLGSSFVGAILVAVATSLPEVSTVVSAVRLGLFTMAISDILGTNLFDIVLIAAVDAAAPGAPVLNQVGPFAAFAALLGIVVTTLFVAGLAERRDRTIFRIGVDSAGVLIAYAGGVAILYGLR